MTAESVVAAPQQHAGSDADRLALLFDAHHQRLYRLARRLSRSVDDARDLVQDTFLRAARSPRSVPYGCDREEAWLVRVLVNLCRDRWRQQSNRGRLDELAHPLDERLADPETAFVAQSMIWQALDVLAPRRRAVMVMHELEGASVADIARLLGVTAVTVRWHLSRGRRQLAAIIGGKDVK
jgi:RNA polymerase sigma-70 factor (ECF subfamily)